MIANVTVSYINTNLSINVKMYINPSMPIMPPYPVSVRCNLRNPRVTTRPLSCHSNSSAVETITAATTVEDQRLSASDTEEATAKPVARRLILLRHAKSSWDNASLRDHDRPLSKVGQTDAGKVSQKLHKLGWIPQLILSSDAVRTRQTLKIMQEEVRGFLDAEAHFFSSFYSVAAMDGQTAEHLQRAICKYSRNDILTVMCMGHNKGWEEAASVFTGASIELKTCNAALLEAIGTSWEEAFALAGHGGWTLQGIVKPSNHA